MKWNTQKKGGRGGGDLSISGQIPLTCVWSDWLNIDRHMANRSFHPRSSSFLTPAPFIMAPCSKSSIMVSSLIYSTSQQFPTKTNPILCFYYIRYRTWCVNFEEKIPKVSFDFPLALIHPQRSHKLLGQRESVRITEDGEWHLVFDFALWDCNLSRYGLNKGPQRMMCIGPVSRTLCLIRASTAAWRCHHFTFNYRYRLTASSVRTHIIRYASYLTWPLTCQPLSEIPTSDSSVGEK